MELSEVVISIQSYSSTKLTTLQVLCHKYDQQLLQLLQYIYAASCWYTKLRFNEYDYVYIIFYIYVKKVNRLHCKCIILLDSKRPSVCSTMFFYMIFVGFVTFLSFVQSLAPED